MCWKICWKLELSDNTLTITNTADSDLSVSSVYWSPTGMAINESCQHYGQFIDDVIAPGANGTYTLHPGSGGFAHFGVPTDAEHIGIVASAI